MVPEGTWEVPPATDEAPAERSNMYASNLIARQSSTSYSRGRYVFGFDSDGEGDFFLGVAEDGVRCPSNGNGPGPHRDIAIIVSPRTFFGITGCRGDGAVDLTNGLRTGPPPTKGVVATYAEQGKFPIRMDGSWGGFVRMELDCHKRTLDMYVTPADRAEHYGRHGATQGPYIGVRDATVLYCSMRGLPPGPLRVFAVVCTSNGDVPDNRNNPRRIGWVHGEHSMA